jgi:processive 1,2-diacylglycerol beta-glucosyltransferase
MSGVLILSTRVGAGHIRAAEAIQKAFAESGATESVHYVETLDYANPLFRRLYTKAYVDTLNTMPALYGFYYDEREKGKTRSAPTGVFAAQHSPIDQTS